MDGIKIRGKEGLGWEGEREVASLIDVITRERASYARTVIRTGLYG